MYIVFQNLAGFRVNWEEIKKQTPEQLILIRNKELTYPIPKGFDAIHLVDKFSFPELNKATKPYTSLYGSNNVRIICNDEHALMYAAEIRTKLNIPGQTDLECKKFRNKIHMKEIMAKSGINIPRYVLFERERFKKNPSAYIDEVISYLQFPIFIKPIDGASSVGTAKIENSEELYKCLSDKLTSDQEFELDEFIEGDLYHCDTLIQNGEVLFFGICKQLRPCFNFTQGIPLATYVLDESDLEYAKLKSFHDQVLCSLGTTGDGSTHLEVFIDQQGKCIFLEVANRTPGAYVPQCYGKMFDFDFETAAFMLQMGKAAGIKNEQVFYGGYIFFPKLKGIVKSINTPVLNSQFNYEYFVKLGDILTETPNNIFETSAKFLIWNKEKMQLRKDLQTLFDQWPLEIVHSEID